MKTIRFSCCGAWLWLFQPVRRSTVALKARAGFSGASRRFRQCCGYADACARPDRPVPEHGSRLPVPGNLCFRIRNGCCVSRRCRGPFLCAKQCLGMGPPDVQRASGGAEYGCGVWRWKAFMGISVSWNGAKDPLPRCSCLRSSGSPLIGWCSGSPA